MFQITETTEAVLTAVTNRIEKHGDDDVPAVSLQISIEAANTLLDEIEPGSTGIHRCHYSGEWPNGHWWIVGDEDLYPSRPVLYRAGPPKPPRKRPADLKTPNARLTGPQRVAHNCN